MMTREFLFYAQPLGTHIYANAPGSVGVSPAAIAQQLPPPSFTIEFTYLSSRKARALRDFFG